MGLINCKIVGEIVLEQTPGVGDIAPYELYITPDDGYVIAAKDLTDNTLDTFSSYVNGIIDFGDTGKLEMVDTITAYGTDNQVKITVNLYPGYSIEEDTTITIDVDGAAYLTPLITRKAILNDRFSTTLTGIQADSSFLPDATPHSVAFALEPGVTVESTLVYNTPSVVGPPMVGVPGQNSAYKRHLFTFTGNEGYETKLATVTLQVGEFVNPFLTLSDVPYSLENPEMGYFIGDVLTGHQLTNTTPNDSGVNQMRSEQLLGISSDGSLPITTFVFVEGVRSIRLQFDLFATPSGATMSIGGVSSGILQSFTDITTHPVLATIPVAVNKLSISNITTSLGSLPNGSFNVIPSSGITLNDTPIVKVYGTPGARFKVELVESRVVEGLSNNRATNDGAVDYFGGIIPDMPVGLAIIPKNGIYSFKMPTIASHTGTGWKEFEMKVTAEPGTTIGPRAVKVGGKSTNIGLSKSTVTNTFYQYPKVNIEFEVVLPSGLGEYEDTYTSDDQLPNFGGTGSGKYGVPMMPPSSDSRLPDSTRTINFEIRLKKLGGAFSLSETFSKSHFVATERDNKDLVRFSKLKARIGRGLSDTTSTAATIFGTIKCNRFGFVNQTYTLDLSKILTFA